MKKISLLIVLAIVACQTKDANLKLPSFRKNSSKGEIWGSIQEIVNQKDFSIVYLEGGGPLTEPGSLSHKIFCNVDEVWQMIEIRKGILESDTINSNVEIIKKDLTLERVCRNEESQAFMNKLLNLGLFKLPDENELIEKCKETGGHVTLTHDAGRVTFYLVHGEDVRTLSFENIEQKIKDCPEVKEFDNILKIQELFRESWFSSKHY